MSFHCPHCGNSNNEIQDGSSMPDKGVKYTVQVKTHQVSQPELGSYNYHTDA